MRKRPGKASQWVAESGEPSDFAPPSDWGNDPLTEFIAATHRLSFATVRNFRAPVKLLNECVDIFSAAIQSLNRYVYRGNVLPPEHNAAQVFLCIAKSAFLGTCTLGLNQQLVEAYKPLRTCLEAGFYGYHVFRDVAAFDRWLYRPLAKDVSGGTAKAAEQKKVRASVGREFSVSAIAKEFPATERRLVDSACQTYEHLIDMGGHPNLRGVAESVPRIRPSTPAAMNISYMGARGPDEMRSFMRDIAWTGSESLRIFNLIFAPLWDHNVSERILLIGSKLRRS